MIAFHDLTMPADPGLVGVARAMAVAEATNCTMEESRIQDVRTCVSEAMTNAVRAHRDAGVPDPILFRVGHDERELVVEVHDCGEGLPGTIGLPQFPSADDEIDSLAEGGYGIPVMHALADAVDLQQRSDPDAGTLVRLRFLLDVGA